VFLFLLRYYTIVIPMLIGAIIIDMFELVGYRIRYVPRGKQYRKAKKEQRKRLQRTRDRLAYTCKIDLLDKSKKV